MVSSSKSMSDFHELSAEKFAGEVHGYLAGEGKVLRAGF